MNLSLDDKTFERWLKIKMRLSLRENKSLTWEDCFTIVGREIDESQEKKK